MSEAPRDFPPPQPLSEDAAVHSGGHGHGRGRRRAHRQRKRGIRPWTWRRRIKIGALTVAALCLALVGSLYAYGKWRYDQIKKVNVPGLTPRSGSAAIDVLLVGSDSRAFVDDSSEASQFGTTSDASGHRSDVIIVARLVPALHMIKLLSIPRDTYVDIPGSSEVSGPNRINAAFDSGPSLLVETISRDFGIPISDYAEVGFPGFAGMVNALGGIYLDFPDPLKDKFSQLNITKTGCQLIRGKQALALVRSRDLEYKEKGEWLPDGGADWSRIQRQDAFFRALIPRMYGAETSPSGLNSLLGAMTGDVTIDKSLSEGALLSLARTFGSISSSGLAVETLPTSTATIDGNSVLIPAAAADQQMINQFLAFGAAVPSTSAFVTPSGKTARVRLTADDVPTVTTIAPATDPGDVVYNTQAEPWNPFPCSA